MTIASKRITDLETVPEARYVYESPDGGLTVYKREVGTDKRYLVKKDPKLVEREKTAARANRLLTILRLSETDSTLKDALEQLEAIYILKYADDKNT